MNLENPLYLSSMNYSSNQFFRFIILGIINTIITYGIYLFCLNYMSYLWSFSLSYICGLLFISFMNLKYVFFKNISFTNIIKNILSYIFQYFISSAMLFIAVNLLSLDKKIALFIVIIVIAPLTFLINRYLLSK